MYQKLGEVTLKDGSQMEIGVVLAPDPAHAEEIRPFLAHKPAPYDEHIRRSLLEPLDALETRFYVGKIAGRIVANVMTVEHRGCGILGHVYTHPDFRRRGACDAIMRLQMEDFRQRGGRALYLGTGFDSPPYHIYRRHGFRSVYPGSGAMVYQAEEGFERRYFAPRPVQSRPVRWEDWGPMNALTSILVGDWLRSVSVLRRVEGPTHIEASFLQMRQQVEAGEALVRVLAAEDGAVVGFGAIGRHPLWREVRLLELFCHPNFFDRVPELVQPLMKAADRPLIAYADEESVQKIAALRSLGFEVEARLRDRVRRRLRPDWEPSSPEADRDDPSAFVDRPLDLFLLRWEP
ncbi:MAG: hypothetical protein KatS3mg115_2591 [Candidatus Poribacteria bacterium]|nr:MAG: hypothetical protein KatS3mg115_2591 [Candidatus Poribacteria bacterium]